MQCSLSPLSPVWWCCRIWHSLYWGSVWEETRHIHSRSSDCPADRHTYLCWLIVLVHTAHQEKNNNNKIILNWIRNKSRELPFFEKKFLSNIIQYFIFPPSKLKHRLKSGIRKKSKYFLIAKARSNSYSALIGWLSLCFERTGVNSILFHTPIIIGALI